MIRATLETENIIPSPFPLPSPRRLTPCPHTSPATPHGSRKPVPREWKTHTKGFFATVLKTVRFFLVNFSSYFIGGESPGKNCR